MDQRGKQSSVTNNYDRLYEKAEQRRALAEKKEYAKRRKWILAAAAQVERHIMALYETQALGHCIPIPAPDSEDCNMYYVTTTRCLLDISNAVHGICGTLWQLTVIDAALRPLIRDGRLPWELNNERE